MTVFGQRRKWFICTLYAYVAILKLSSGKRGTCDKRIPDILDAEPRGMYEPPFKLGTKIRYNCRPGFESTRGPIYAKCVLRGNALNWELSNSECVRKSCGHPGDIMNGRRIGDDFRFGRRVTYECYPGYKMSGMKTIFCGTTGEWTRSPPKCEKERETVTLCPDPPRSPQMRIVDMSPDKTRHNVGKRIYFQCKNENAQMTECLANGKWSIEPRCQKKTCEDTIPEFENAEPDRKYIPPFKLRTVIRYNCKPGYYKSQGLFASCRRKNGSPTWLRSSGECIPKNCGHPGDIRNGRRIGDLFTFGSIVKYECYPGFKLKGISTIQCDVNQEWTSFPPKCEPI